MPDDGSTNMPIAFASTMPAYPKRTYPPLFPPGLSEVQLQDLGQLFVGPAFDTPLRRRMTVQLRMFIGELERLGVHGELWIDGSFATKKREPGDIDLALSIPRVIVSAMSDESLERLRFLSDEENRAYVRSRWQVDLYVFESSNVARRAYFLEQFSRNPDSANRKGFPFVKL